MGPVTVGTAADGTPEALSCRAVALVAETGRELSAEALTAATAVVADVTARAAATTRMRRQGQTERIIDAPNLSFRGMRDRLAHQWQAGRDSRGTVFLH
jgi:hypothetical protein